jgi:hypothetical protein
MSAEDDYALDFDVSQKNVTEEVEKRCQARAKQMLRDLKKVNPRQYELVTDPSPHIAGLCPRRAGKSYAGAAAALIAGESKKGTISIIISLNKQQLRRIYWSGGPSGLYRLARKYKLNLEFNNTFLRWEHENGSIGYLLGCEDDEQMEVIRGLEADLYLIDECKSFAPMKLNKLIDDIIDPQRGSRNARVMLIGTPGFIAAGPFYEATCDKAVDEDERPFCVKWGTVDPWNRTPAGDLLWSLHTWTLQENSVMPQQWDAALLKKKQKKWKDDHPTWQREYLGMWTVSSEGLVFSYSLSKASCTWKPEVTEDNPSGLPREYGPWRFIAGLDIGYEAPTALVVCAYSAQLHQLRHVVDYSKKHLLPHEVASLVQGAERNLGCKFEVVYADMANLGVMVAEELVRDYGIPLEKAEKRNKNDFIELINSAFSLGELLIIQDTVLEHQLLTNAWDIDEEYVRKDMSAKENMARMSKLVEDKSIPNDSTDALVYLYRGSLHRFGKTKKEERLTPGTTEWFKAKEKRELEDFRKQLKKDEKAKRRGQNALPKMPRGLQMAFERKNIWDSRPTLN